MLKTVLPVLLMLIIGKFLSQTKTVSADAIDGIKTIVSDIMLPVVVFNAILNMEFTEGSAIISFAVFGMYSVMLILGLAVKSMSAHYHVIPFLLSGSEGGMIGYPLYISLYGNESLATMMPLDLGNILYTFTVYMILIQLVNNGSIEKRQILFNSLKNRFVIFTVAALILNLTGFGRIMLESSLGEIYGAMVSMLTSSVTALILITVGYDLNLDKNLLLPVIKTCLSRFAVMAICLITMLTAFRGLIVSREMLIACILYFSLPPQFVVTVFIQENREREYAATVLSVYTLLTILCFIMLTTFLPLT